MDPSAHPIYLLQSTTRLLQTALCIEWPPVTTWETLQQKLAAHLSQIVEKDFQQFVWLLYRLDVSEKKVRDLLADPHQRQPLIAIASLIIERQLQKLKTREQSKPPTYLPDEEELW